VASKNATTSAQTQATVLRVEAPLLNPVSMPDELLLVSTVTILLLELLHALTGSSDTPLFHA